MNDLKKRYSFFIDLFLPEDEDFVLRQFHLAVKKSVRILDYYIYPVNYTGFFQSRYYLLLKRESFLFKDKDQVRTLVCEKLSKGLSHLYQLNFKELFLAVEDYVDEFDEPAEYLLLGYGIQDQEVLFLIPVDFLADFSLKFFRTFERKKHDKIFDLLDHARTRLYQDHITTFWDFRNFFKELSHKDVQNLFHALLKNNMIEETMLTGFIAFFYGTEIVEKIMRNLSENLQKEVMRNFHGFLNDKRWIEECVYLVRLAVEELLFVRKIVFPSLAYMHELRGRIREERYRRIFQEKSFSLWLEEAARKDIIDPLKLKLDTKTILISLKDMDKQYLALFLRNISARGMATIQEDYHFNLKVCTEEEVFQSRVMIVETMKNIFYEKKAEDISVFQGVLTRLSRSQLSLLIEHVGVVRFSQAVLHENKEFKKVMLHSVSGVVQNLLVDINSGKVRFKQSFGEQTVKRAKQDVLRFYYSLRGEEGL